MLRRGSLAFYAYEYLSRERPGGATLAEIRAELQRKTKRQVLPHSLRAAVYMHLDGAGEHLFERTGRGRYRARY